MISPTFKSLLLANINVTQYDDNYRRIVLINILLICIIVGFGLFTFLNIFILNNYMIGLFNFLSFLVGAYAMYDIRMRKQEDRAAYIVTATFFIFLLLLIYLLHGKDFTLIWTIFLPIIAIFSLGSKPGLAVSLLFYFFAFLLTYHGISAWEDVDWTMKSYFRFVIANLILLYLAYLFEQSFEKASVVLKKSRDKEQEKIVELHVASITDPLTKLYNRRNLDAFFERSFNKAKANGSYFGFFILDLDFYKAYNDIYGHLKGDNVLEKVASVLKENMKREYDYAFRMGGEEFGGFMVADNYEKIINNVERIRFGLEDLGILHEGNTHKVLTGSFGVAVIHDFKIRDFDKMYNLADKFLYASKASGKNCVNGKLVDLAQ